MLRTYICYFLAWAYVIFTYPVMMRVRFLDRRGRAPERDRLADRYAMRISKRLLRLIGADVRISGLENIPENAPVLFVSNHQSHIDNLIILGCINVPKGFVSIVEMLKVPILRTLMKYIKCVFLDRANIRQTLQCMEEAAATLRGGHSMVIFPEGRVNEDGVLGEFKKGCLKLAVKAGVPIVPVTLINSNRLMSRDGSRIYPGHVECIVSAPVSTEVHGKADEALLIEKVRNVIKENLKQ